MTKKATEAGKKEIGKRPEVAIKPPQFGHATVTIIGASPLVINAFSRKTMEQMREKQENGSSARTDKKREAKDFKAAYEAAKHVSREGWCGISAAAFRNAMISACRIANFKMTLAKLSVFVEADGYDRVDGTPLVRITKGTPQHVEHLVRNATGVPDIRPRPMWTAGWEARVHLRWDADQFKVADILNLLGEIQ